MHKTLLLIFCGLLLSGCEQLGIEDPAKAAALRDAEGRAIGGACRHSGRALEDCYNLNKKASKAAIFSGWRDMDAYMRENNIEISPPTAQPPARPNTEPAPPPATETPPPKQGAATTSGESKPPARMT